MSSARRRLLAGALGVALILPAGGAAAQVEPPVGPESTDESRPGRDPSRLEERLLAAVERRVRIVVRLGIRVARNPGLTDEHRRQLIAELDDHESGLLGLAEEIEAASSGDEIRSLIPRVIEDHRIRVLIRPKVGLVIGSDTGAAAAVRLRWAAERLAAAIDRAENGGFDVEEARSLLGEMITHAEAGERLAGPVAESVVPLTPAAWPDSAQSVLENAREDLRQAREEVRAGRRAGMDATRALWKAIGRRR